MSDDLVKPICSAWIADDRSDDCFWEGWPECPTPEDSLTPKMVMDRIEELEAKLTKAEGALSICSASWGECNRVLDETKAQLARVIAAYRIEAMRRDDYSHDAFDQHIAALKETPHD